MEKTILLFATLFLLWSCDSPSADAPSEANQGEKETLTPLASFVALDQAYIPPLFFTSVEKSLSVKLASLNYSRNGPIFVLLRRNCFQTRNGRLISSKSTSA